MAKKTKSMGKIKHIRTVVDGITFDSRTESDYYVYLKSEKAKGNVIDFKLQPVFLLQHAFVIYNGKVIEDIDPEFAKIKRKNKLKTILKMEYISDFEVTYKDGSKKIIDVKGSQITADFKIKKKLFEYRYPNETLQLMSFDIVTQTWMDYYELEKLKKCRKKAKKEASVCKEPKPKRLAKEKKNGAKSKN